MKKLRKMNVQKSARKMVWLEILLAVAVLQCVGCTVGPKYHRPPVQTPPAYKEMGNWKTAQPNDQKLSSKWWEIFQDAQLNALEDSRVFFSLLTSASCLLRFPGN